MTYAGDSFLVGDDVADALLDLGAALANSGRALHIKVPALDAGDGPVTIGLVLGPSSQFVCRPALSSSETTHGEFVEKTRRAIRGLTSTSPFPLDLEEAGRESGLDRKETPAP